jgi:uncharacterized protein YcbX
MPTVEAINISPVKSFGLSHPQRVHVGSEGILEDRRFLLMSNRGKLVTQRQIGRLVQVKAEYDAATEELALSIPDSPTLRGVPERGEAATVDVFGRDVSGNVVLGNWNDALSDFCNRRVKLVITDKPGQAFDEFPVSILTQASIEELSRQPGITKTLDNRRFRPNFLIGGCRPHEEDEWVWNMVQIGNDLRVRVAYRDPRCAITTHDPDTGKRDADTLRAILSYRPDKEAYFGVYGVVENPGVVSIGDPVTAIIDG